MKTKTHQADDGARDAFLAKTAGLWPAISMKRQPDTAPQQPENRFLAHLRTSCPNHGYQHKKQSYAEIFSNSSCYVYQILSYSLAMHSLKDNFGQKTLCSIEMNEMVAFELTDDDRYAIEVAQNIARRFLKHPKITPQQVIGLGNALFALERLPLVTPGSSCEFGIVYRAGTEEFSEMRYIDFRISDSAFEISKGGSVYDKSVGGDSFSEPGWVVEVGGYRSAECELYDLEDSIAEYLNLGAEITVSDESEIEYE
jgi:hypothetical protein